MRQNSLTGAWRMTSFELRSADGQVNYPFGQDAIGYLICSPDGYMSVAFMRSYRPEFGLDDPTQATMEEKALAADTFFSYCGRYEIHEDRVVHHIEVSLFPNWVGLDQERIFRIEGDTLMLSTPPFQVGGIEQTAWLIWERV